MKIFTKLGITFLLAVFATGVLWAQTSEMDAAKIQADQEMSGAITDADITPMSGKNMESMIMGTDDTDIIGGTTNAYNAGPRVRGNAFYCSMDVILVEFMGWHDVTTDPTTMWMLVYEGDAAEGDYTLVSSTDITPAPIGLGWVSSGEINYPMEAGKYYMLVASFQEACGYYADSDIDPWPYPVSFGEAIGGVGFTWAPAVVFPPDETVTVDVGAWVEPVLYHQQIITELAVTYDDDLGIHPISSPNSGVELGMEDVTATIKNYGTNAQTDFDVSYTLDGGAAVTETVVGTLNGGESIDYTFSTQVDLSAFGEYVIEVCTMLADENPDNDCKTKDVENAEPSICVPEYSTGCSWGDGFTDFELGEIVNNGSGCADLNGPGWSQYFELGPAELEAGMSYTISMATGYENNYVCLWIDFDDNLLMTEDEKLIDNFNLEEPTVFYEVTIDIPADALGGQHIMRARTNWDAPFTDACEALSFGEAEDYYVNISGGAELCVPAYTTGCSDGDGFTDFALGEIENYGSGCEDNMGLGWSQYFDLGPAELAAGGTYTVTMASGYANNHATIWIDYNDDLEFTEDEQIVFNEALPEAGVMLDVEFILPADAAGGMHIMRARTNYNGDCLDACEEYAYGEAEDYYVNVAGVELDPPLGLAANVDDDDVTLNWLAPGSGDDQVKKIVPNALKDLLGYNVYRDGAMLDYTTATTYEDMDLDPGTYVYYVTGVYDEGESGSSNEATAEIEGYCTASTANEDEWIDIVECGDIYNDTDWQAGVADYTDLSTSIEVGGTVDITVTNGTPYDTDAASVWVDWNDDFVFDIGGDEEFILDNDGSGAIFTGTITCPAGTAAGDHRMRIRLVYNSVPEPCGGATYGEVEDYTLTAGDGTTADCEDFDALTVGGLVAEQLGGMWTTWSGTSADDATVSDMYSNSPDNSFVVDAGTVDLVRKFDDVALDAGQWLYSNYIYVPTGFSGYFNVQSDPVPGVEWVVELFFNDDGTGNFTQNTIVTEYTYAQNSWILVEINFDLDADFAEIYFDGALMKVFAWEGTIGGIDYFGWDVGGTPGAYFDDVCFAAGWIYTNIEEQLANTLQLYPNPANDHVNITSDYTMESVTVYNFAGQVILTESVNSTTYRVNTSNFDAGIYLFQLETKEGRIAKRIIIE